MRPQKSVLESVLPDDLSETLWTCAPCWYWIRIARDTTLAKHMLSKGEMESPTFVLSNVFLNTFNT